MGEALVKGLRAAESRTGNVFSISATTRSQESAAEAAKRLGIRCDTDNGSLVHESDVIIVCVKPHQAEAALKKVAAKFKPRHLIISICASLTTEQVARWSGGKAAVIRAMPNTPCLIGEGMTVISAGKTADRKHMETAESIFGTVGKTAVIEESLMDGATGLSGCGPAYVYLMVEALSEAGVKVGLPRKVATLLAAQTLQGSSKMVLQRQEHPAALKDERCYPG